MQNDGVQAKLLKEPGHLMFQAAIATMHDEIRVRSLGGD